MIRALAHNPGCSLGDPEAEHSQELRDEQCCSKPLHVGVVCYTATETSEKHMVMDVNINWFQLTILKYRSWRGQEFL